MVDFFRSQTQHVMSDLAVIIFFVNTFCFSPNFHYLATTSDHDCHHYMSNPCHWEMHEQLLHAHSTLLNMVKLPSSQQTSCISCMSTKNMDDLAASIVCNLEMHCLCLQQGPYMYRKNYYDENYTDDKNTSDIDNWENDHGGETAQYCWVYARSNEMGKEKITS